ncbi:MAG: hypothetical protein GW858_12480 [Sphingomonadales bacterium]|nr:hypothetical protein [Sphingomonadales bacterium]NCQ21819.1 hypothetical protein [Sphingomonadales bacterium]NCT04531.1 hypothetical protein [Sphingomonadales bacterium]
MRNRSFAADKAAASSARIAGLMLGAVMLSACAQTIAKSRVESALIDAGLGERNATCMAERMVDRLSISQLRKLEGLKAQNGESARPTTLDGYIDRVRRVGDAEVLAVTSSSAALCAVGLG